MWYAIFAKYGRRDALRQIGHIYGDAGRTDNCLCGGSRKYGMRDTVVRNSGSYTAGCRVNIGTATYPSYVDTNVPTFLGIERIWPMKICTSKCYIFAAEPSDIGNIRTFSPDCSTIRNIFSVSDYDRYGNQPNNIIFPVLTSHGKYCDISSAGRWSWSEVAGYTDSQVCYHGINEKSPHINLFGHAVGGESGTGCIALVQDSGILSSDTGTRARMLFRGTIIETNDVDKYLEAEELRG